VRDVGYADDDLRMPPCGKLPEREIAAPDEWVRSGAANKRVSASGLSGSLAAAETE
jgi:hypothetical protein